MRREEGGRRRGRGEIRVLMKERIIWIVVIKNGGRGREGERRVEGNMLIKNIKEWEEGIKIGVIGCLRVGGYLLVGIYDERKGRSKRVEIGKIGRIIIRGWIRVSIELGRKGGGRRKVERG